MGIIKRKPTTLKSPKRRTKNGVFAGAKPGRGRKIGFGVFAVAVAVIAGLSVWNIAKAAPVVYNFAYTGNVQTFTAPEDGEYTFEAWGAQGGQPANKSVLGGAGGYTSGEISLKKGDTFYVYVGQQRNDGAAAWNAGSTGGYYGGGGATDFRLSNGTWGNANGLRSRVVVAGGGGAATSYSATAKGGYGGGLIGGSGTNVRFDASYLINIPPTGGTQVSGGLTTRNTSVAVDPGTPGAFGVGGSGGCSVWGTGGGSGYYGGGGAGCTSGSADSGGGGSSYISGHTGAVAIKSAANASPRLASDNSTVCTPALATTDMACASHYSGYIFRDTIVKAGNETFLSPTGVNETGHAGSGYARISGETYTDNADKPTIDTISPNTGSTFGGQSITITGNNLDYIGATLPDTTQMKTKVTIGGVACTDVTSTANTLTCKAGRSAVGTYDVTVYNGKRSTKLENGYTYTHMSQPRATIDTIVPNSGPVAGGQEAVIFGNNFTSDTKVYFGNTPAVVTSVTGSTLTVTTPLVTQPGERDVRVTGSDALVGGYMYIPGIAITNISPASGANNGGYPVTIQTSGNLTNQIDFVQVESAVTHSVGLDATGRVYTWGANTYGQLGDGSATTATRAIPGLAKGALDGKRIVSISSKAYGAVALDDQGKVYTWGYGVYGALGNGATANSAVPVDISSSGALAGKKIVKISSGWYNSMAIDDQGKIYAWGNNNMGQLGTGNTTNSLVPVDISGSGALAGRKIVDISSGGESTQYVHSMALDDQGKVYTWGYDYYGELGNGAGGSSYTPIQISDSSILAGKKIVSIEAGVAQSYALDDMGELFSWGYGEQGALGTGSMVNSQVPVSVTNSALAGETITQISAGYRHAMALSSDNTVYSWGYNNYGQLGNGGAAIGSVPVSITSSGALAGKKIMSVKAGYATSMAVGDQGVYYAWGLNTSRQFGNNTVTDSYVPLAVPRITENINLAVKFGDNQAEITSRTQNELRVKAPAHDTGAVDVDMLMGGRSVNTKTDGFAYTGETKINNVTPNNGPTIGGQQIQISGDNLAAPAIPATYTPIEYINFTGTQYINTGIDQLNNPKVIVDFQADAASTQQIAPTIVGVRNSDVPPYTGTSRISGASSAGVIVTYYNAASTNTLNAYNIGSMDTSRHIVETGYTGTTLTTGFDGTMQTMEQTVPTVPTNYFIGALSTGNVAAGTTYYKGKIYGVQIYKNNTLVRDFQPVRRASDNVLGLYDRANGVFYANSGTGTFGAGAVLGSNAYLGAVTVGGAPCTSPTIAGDVITCTTSAHTKGKVDVAVFNGVETVTSTNGYEYIMAVDTVTPSAGPIEGRQAVTVTGENLQTPATGYTAVDYLNFTGTQYINTGITQVNNPKIIVDFQPDATGQVESATIFGVTGVNAQPFPSGSMLRIAPGGLFQYIYNRAADNVSSGLYFTTNSGNRSVFEMAQNGSEVKLNFDGDARTVQQYAMNPTYARPYHIGAGNYGGALGSVYRGKVFSMQMYENGTPVRDFQPARRNSDNVLGMYDKLNKVFYANNGTGTFGAGAVKSDAYMGVVKLGGSVCSDPRLVSSGVITCTSGSSTAGVFDVTVNNTVDTATLPGSYEYRADNFLQSLTSDKGTLAPSFDRDVMDYTLTLPASEPCVTIGAVASDASATVVGTGNQCRKGGETIVVTVTAANGETRDYTLSVVRPASDDATLADLQVDGATIAGYDPATKTYEMEISDHRVREVEIGYEKGHYYQTTTPSSGYTVAIEPGTTATDITVVNEDGSKTSTYTIVLTQPHTTKLMSLASDGSLSPSFDSDTLNYEMSVFDGVIGVNVNAVPYDSDATVTVTGAAYIPNSGGMVTVKVTREGVGDSVYTIHVTKESADMQTVYDFPYKGSVQVFVAPVTAEYLFEAWGAQGGQPANKSVLGGAGGYTSGKINLQKGDTFYVYVGQQRNDNGVAWNAGSYGGYYGGGGGATDFRLASSAWDNVASLRGRVLVAGGGGGASAYDQSAKGGYGGGLVAGNGNNGKYPGGSYVANVPPTGGTQTSGGLTSKNNSVTINAGQPGVFGTGGNAHPWWGAGGGGGYYGGGGGGYTGGSVDSGAGGSSYISGHEGAVAVKSATDTSPRLASDGSTVCTAVLAETDEKCSEHYSEFVFHNTAVQRGDETMFSPAGANELGHAGSGFARVTVIVPPSNDNTLAELSYTNSTLSPSFDPAAAEGTPYTLAVPSNQPVITTNAVANHRKAVVTGNGVETVLPADTPTPIVVSVVSESGLVRDYVTTATRPADANSRLNMLTMGSIPSGLCRNNGEYAAYSCRFNDSGHNAVFFNPAVTDYYINVPTVSRKLNFTATKGHLFQNLTANVSEGTCTVDNTNPVATGAISCDGLPMGASEIAITATAETGATTTYTLHVFRTPGADIQGIEVVDTPDEAADVLHFNPLATDYGVTGQPDTEAVNFEVTVDSEVDVQVKFGANGSFVPCAVGGNGKPVCAVDGLVLKKNDIWIQATLNGMVKTYYINWYRQLNSNTFLEYLTVQDAQNVGDEFELSPSFDKAEDTYTTYVPFTTTEVLISAEAERPDLSTVLGDTGVKAVAVGNNRLVVRVQAQDGSQGEYVVNVVRRADPNATVANIETSTPFAPAFDPDTQNYVMDLDPHFTAIDFTKIEMQSGVATYEVLGNSDIVPGVTEVTVRGVAADGTTRDYVFTVHMEPSNNTALASLQASCGAYAGETLSGAVNCQLVPVFDADETAYSMTVPGEVATVTLSGTPADDLSTVTGWDTYELETGTNQFNITVTAQDGSVRTVTVTVERQQDSNNRLKTWTLKGADGQAVNFGFAPQTNDYTLTVENDVKQLSVAATAQREASQVVLGAGSPWKLNVGANNFAITVVAENGETNIYSIVITRKPSVDTCLSKLTLQEAKISPAFACQTTAYTAEVPYRVTAVTPMYGTVEPNATVTVTGANNLQVGDNQVTVKVTAEDGVATKEYTVTVNRHEDTAFSSRLVNLWTDVGTWDKTFDPDTLYYEVDVAPTVAQVKVGGLIEDIDGPATVNGLGTHALAKGENIIQTVVTATDGSTTTYTLNVKRALSTDANLKLLAPNRSTLSPNFQTNVLMYTTTADEEFIDLTALPRDDGATVEGANGSGVVRYPLEVGANTIDVRVTAEDGVTTKVYTVVVTRLVGVNAQLAQLTVGGNMPLTPSFKETTGAYTVANVPATTDKLTVYAKTRDTTATVRIGGAEYAPREATSEVALAYGANHITVDVTAANGTNKMQYVVTVVREASGNNNLAKFAPSVGTISPAFNPSITTYTLDVDYMTKQLSLESLVEHEMARISYSAGTYYSAAQNKKSMVSAVNLPGETTVVTVQVMAMNGVTKNYDLIVRRNQHYPSTLDNLQVTPYDLVENFSSSTLNYTVEVDYEIDNVSKLPINAVKSDPNATVAIGGGALGIGPNAVPITVTSRDGSSTTTYNLNVIRRSYANNFLTYLSTNQSAEIVPDFDKYTLGYSMTVGNTVSTLNLSAEPENYNSSVKVGNTSFTGQGAAYSWPVALQYGDNVIDITVTTATNVKRVYKLTVARELSQNTDLSSVSFKAGSQTLETCDASAVFDPATMDCAYTPAFANSETAYTVHVPAGTARGEINVVPANGLATVTGGGEVELVAGHNEFTVTVQAQDGTSRQITVDFVREALSVNKLIELQVVPGAEDGTSLEPTFAYNYDATVAAPYVVHVPGRVAMLGFEVQLEDSLYSTVSGVESAPVPDGESTRQIVVTAENGDQRVYNILLVKTPLDTNNFLDDLTVDGETVPGFAPTEKFSYDMGTVSHDKSSVDIAALVTDPAVIVSGTGKIDLVSGDNNLQIQVKAENDDIRTYTVHIYRTPNDDNTLANIVIPKHTLTNPFQPYNVTYYVITSSKTTHDSLEIQPVLSSPGDATYEIQYMQPEFEVGSNLVKIVVTAENGEQMTYFIYVVLQNIDENYHLEYLNTDIYELMAPTDPTAVAFSPTNFEYDIRVPMSQDRMCVTARAESIQATILGAQDLANATASEACYDLDVGINHIPVMVTAGNGVVKEYMLNVTREGTAGISKIVAVPEKRIPGKGNSNTWFLVEVVPAGQPYAKADGSGTNVVWDNKADVLAGARHQSDDHGVWDSAVNGGVMDVAVEGGTYDVYFTGYSHLSKKKAGVQFIDGTPIEIDFTYDEDTLADMVSAGTLAADDAMYPLLAGDAGAASDSDLSCGPVISNCVTGGMFSGDEYGDDLVNSLDTSAILTKLYATKTDTQKSLTTISKEDLDGNGQINSLDLSITLNNLFKRGDK